MLKDKRFLIGVAVSIVLLSLFLYTNRTYFAGMGQAFKEANYILIIPGVLIYFCGVYFRALRWKFFLKPLGNFSSFRLFPLVVIGFMVNNVLPGRLGIIARAYMLGEKEKISKMAVGGTMVAEQVFDGVMLLVFAFCISVFAPLSGTIQTGVYIAAGLFFAALLLCFVLVLSPRFAKRGIATLLVVVWSKKWRSKAEGWLLRLVEGLQFMRSPKKLVITLILSVLVWLCEAGLFYMVSLSFVDLNQPFYIMLLVTSVASLSWALIFVAQGGLGVFDYFCQQTLFLLIPTGILADNTLAEAYKTSVGAYVIVLHIVLLFPVIALGFVCLWKEKFSLAKLIGYQKKGVNKEIMRRTMKNWIRAKLNHKLWFWYIECTGCGKVLTWQEAGFISIEGAKPVPYCKTCLKSLGEKERISFYIPRS